jgi:hypothetical protein
MKDRTKQYIDRLVCENPQVPIVQSIIFPNGDLFRFERSGDANEKQENIKFLDKSTIDDYFEQNSEDDISHCYTTTSAENNIYRAYAGEGSWGDDGIIYVVKKTDNQLVWFLFSDRSNPFSKIEIKDNTIIAVSTLDQCWTIPINTPEKLKIESTNLQTSN